MSRSGTSKNPSKETDDISMILRIRVSPVAAKGGVAVVVPSSEALPHQVQQSGIYRYFAGR
jgi:hypothetical protein